MLRHLLRVEVVYVRTVLGHSHGHALKVELLPTCTTHRQTDRVRQLDRQTDKWTDRQRDRQADIQVKRKKSIIYIDK